MLPSRAEAICNQFTFVCIKLLLPLIVSWEMKRGNDLNVRHDEWKLSGLNIVWVGTILDWIFWIWVIRVGIFWVVIILGENFPGGKCPGGSCPRWEFSGWELCGWELSWVIIFLGGNFSGGDCPLGIIRAGVFLVP